MKQTIKRVNSKTTITTQKTSPYEKLEKNIYKTGKSYRVRVGRESKYCDTITQARNWRKVFQGTHTWDSSYKKVVKA